MVMRYEDLVTEMEKQARKLGEWLGVTLDHFRVERDRESFRHL